MKVLGITLLALVAAVAAKSIDFQDVIDVEKTTAYDYHNKVGIPLADEIRAYEAQPQSARIVGGSAAQLGQFPYQVGLIIDLARGQSVCGGSILNQRRALTAAHCWNDGSNQARQFTVVAGSITLFSGGQRIVTNDVVMHQNWNPSTITNDVAIIRLATAFSFSNTVGAIALPSGGEVNDQFAGEIATASGFGRTSDGAGGAISSRQFLSFVNLPVISNAECRRTWNIPASNICASGAGGRSTCGGDSGGPLVVTRNNRRILIGATSFGHRDGCQIGYPPAFARVTSFLSWINARL